MSENGIGADGSKKLVEGVSALLNLTYIILINRLKLSFLEIFIIKFFLLKIILLGIKNLISISIKIFIRSFRISNNPFFNDYFPRSSDMKLDW